MSLSIYPFQTRNPCACGYVGYYNIINNGCYYILLIGCHTHFTTGVQCIDCFGQLKAARDRLELILTQNATRRVMNTHLVFNCILLSGAGIV